MLKTVRFLFLFLLAAPSSYAASNRLHSYPRSLDAQEDLRRQILIMKERSSTFRDQCQRLDVSRLHVKLRTDTQLIDKPYRGRSVIQRSDNGLVAWVNITPFGDPTEWIAHELEHVIEQLEGISVPTLAMTSSRSAWHTTENMFETERALRAGRQVLHEVQDATRAVAHAAVRSLDVRAAQGDD